MQVSAPPKEFGSWYDQPKNNQKLNMPKNMKESKMEEVAIRGVTEENKTNSATKKV